MTEATRKLTTLFCLATFLSRAIAAGEESRLRGYAEESARTQKEWEAKFRAIPDARNLRAYMERMAARPHHLGSPYDKDNAEWILSKFKEWGLDARFDIYEVLFPTPKERALELIEPV